MAARAIWTGTLKVGSTGLPVKLYSAVEDQSIHFHILDSKTKSRVKQHMVNPATGEEVSSGDIRKGYEIESGTFLKEADKRRACGGAICIFDPLRSSVSIRKARLPRLHAESGS